LDLAAAGREDWRRLKDELKRRAPEFGIDKIGFASADPFDALRDILLRHREKGRESGFEEPDIEKRVRPDLNFDKPRSLIAIAVAYPAKLKNPPRSEKGATRGIIARAAWGEDYHHVLKRRLERLADYIRECVPDARVESMVDTGALVDRAVAERAGIGWSGKNCAVITPEFGSWVYLGEMITNLPFEPDTPVAQDCRDCTRCLDACPTGALEGPGELNATRCLSFLSQTKGILDDEFKRKLGNRLYGCDTCQVVCPKNKGLNWTHQPELQPDPEEVKPLLLPLLKLSNRQYKERYGRNASSWRGKNPIQRNAVIALGNFRDESAVPTLRELLLADPRPAIRESAAWALGRIGGASAGEALEQARGQEADEAVRTALERALKQLHEQV
jgi:epoxyqueuosine reductase